MGRFHNDGVIAETGRPVRLAISPPVASFGTLVANGLDLSLADEQSWTRASAQKRAYSESSDNAKLDPS
jgi:hypothetical protein